MLLGSASAWLLWPVNAVRVTAPNQGAVLGCAAARDGAPLRITYLHSIYGQPGEEELRVSGSRLELVRLRSASVPVLEYYQRPEPIKPEGGGYVIEVPPERHESLTVLVSALGQRTVTYDGRTWPLHTLVPDGTRVRIAVERTTRMCTLWPMQAVRR